MHKVSYALFALPMLLLGSIAQAQTAGTITFSANKTSSTGSFAPVLTWSTSPVATSCSASGGWSGTKFASGSETVASISANASYTLTCAWGNGSATISWTAPTKNTNGSSLTDLASYKILFGNSSTSLTQEPDGQRSEGHQRHRCGARHRHLVFHGPRREQQGCRIVEQRPGAEDGEFRHRRQDGVHHRDAAVDTAADHQHDGRGPNPAYDVVTTNNVRALGKQVGWIHTGMPCDSSYGWAQLLQGRNSDVHLSTTPRSSAIVAYC